MYVVREPIPEMTIEIANCFHEFLSFLRETLILSHLIRIAQYNMTHFTSKTCKSPILLTSDICVVALKSQIQAMCVNVSFF